MWIGVGSNPAITHRNRLRPKESAVEKIKTGEYSNPVYNDRIQYNLPYTASGVPLMSMMLSEMANEVDPDWRVLGVRAALWDTIRESTTTDVTGVQWASAVNQDHFKLRVNTDEIEVWMGFSSSVRVTSLTLRTPSTITEEGFQSARPLRKGILKYGR